VTTPEKEIKSPEKKIITPRSAKRINIQYSITQFINGLVTFILGLVSINRRRDQRYVVNDSGYPMANVDFIDWDRTLLYQYSPILVAFILNLINAIYIFLFRKKKEIKIWMKILIVSLTGVFLLVTALFPAHVLSPVSLTVNVWQPSYYGVYPSEKKNKRNALYNGFRSLRSILS
jgi:hypothetical protein